MAEARHPAAPGTTAVLCSAGLDSAVLLAHEAAEREVVPVYVSVGFSWEAEEWEALGRLVRAPVYEARVRAPVRLEFNMRDIYPPTHWAIRGVPPAYDTPDEDVYLVGRNVTLLAKAAIFSAQAGISRIVLGLLAGNPFPDATLEFFAAIERALSTGLDTSLEVAAPFRTLHKADVITLGVRLQVPLASTISCMRPRDGVHCGACSKCRERHDAFVEAAVQDSYVYVKS